jgi:hypothetical protein
MKLWQVKRGTALHGLLQGAVNLNATAFEPTYFDDGKYSPLLRRFRGNMMNFCEVSRHVILWTPLYLLVHVLMIAMPLTAIFVYPVMRFGVTPIMWYFIVAAGVAAVIIALMFLVRTTEKITDARRAAKEEKRAAEQHAEPVVKKENKFFKWLVNFMVNGVFKFIGRTLLLFGLIPAIFKFIAMLYTMFKDNFCPMVEIVDDETETTEEGAE